MNILSKNSFSRLLQFTLFTFALGGVFSSLGLTEVPTPPNRTGVFSVDGDSDGVDTSREDLDGTDPADPDSYIEHAGREYCLEWNGFLFDLLQILELRNAGCSAITVRVELRDILGAVQDTVNLTLAQGKQFDLIVNKLIGFQSASIGTVCATITSGDADSLDTRLSVYESGVRGFNFATAAEGVPARAGSQFVGFNNLFPTLALSQLGNNLAGFIQISNLENTEQTGELLYFDEEGVEIRRVSLSLLPRGRQDVDTHTIGRGKIGLVEWRPTDDSMLSRMSLNRYYFNGAEPDASLASIAALSGKFGSGHLLASPFDSRSRLTVLELSNSLGVPVQGNVSVYDSAGALAGTQPEAITIPAKGTRHVVMNHFLQNSLGKVQVHANLPRSLVANLMEYGLDASQGLVFATSGPVSAGYGINHRASYNNFLGSCRLRLANLSSISQSVAVAMKRFDGSALTVNTPLILSANSTSEIDLCERDPQSGYGEVLLTPSAPERVVGQLIRANEDGSSEFQTSLKGSGVCVADLEVSSTNLALTAGSNTPVSITVTNNSEATTATNVQATLPLSWTDVSQDKSSCETLSPGGSCQLQFTPGNTIYSSQTIEIDGDNAPAVSVTASVVAPLTATISVAGSPLSLTQSGSSGSITVTNTSLFTAATNITATFTGSALAGNVTESGNTCASVAPGASCTLTFTPGASTVPETSFAIGGSNTNQVSGAMSIVALPASISVTGTPLTLYTNGSAGSITVTNNSSTVSALNITAELIGTALDGNVTLTGNTCTGSLAPSASCTLSFTPGSTQVALTTFTISGSNTTTASAQIVVGELAIGTSYQGGTIGCLGGGLSNLIAATADNSTSIAFGGNGITTGGTSNSDGATNTTSIVTAVGTGSNYAARLCSDYEIDSLGNTPCTSGTCYSDWFLPAFDQMLCLYQNRVAVGGFSTSIYWTSTEVDSTLAWLRGFNLGNQIISGKFNSVSVRCVRSFTP